MRSPITPIEPKKTTPAVHFSYPSASTTTTTNNDKSTNELEIEASTNATQLDKDGESLEKMSTNRSEAFTPSSARIVSTSKMMEKNDENKVDPTLTQKTSNNNDSKPNGMNLSNILPPSWSSFLGLNK